MYNELSDNFKKQQTIISDLVTMVDLLEAKLSKHQRLLNILIYKDNSLAIETTSWTLNELTELSDLLQKEGIELDV